MTISLSQQSGTTERPTAEESLPKIFAAYRRAAEDRRPWWVKRWAQAVCKHRNVEPWYHAWYCLDCGKVTHD